MVLCELDFKVENRGFTLFSVLFYFFFFSPFGSLICCSCKPFLFIVRFPLAPGQPIGMVLAGLVSGSFRAWDVPSRAVGWLYRVVSLTVWAYLEKHIRRHVYTYTALIITRIYIYNPFVHYHHGLVFIPHQ